MLKPGHKPINALLLLEVFILLLLYSAGKDGETMCFFKRTLVYSCFGNEKYFAIVNKLNNAGIKHTTRFINNNRSLRGHSTAMDRTIQYDIYVKKEDEHIALQAIHTK